MTLNTYLLFDGNCREVFEFYKSVFGGEFSIFMTFADGPEDMQIPDGEHENVMHVSLPIGNSVLMGSDVPSGHGSSPPIDTWVTISRSPTHPKAGKRRIPCSPGLSEGGTVTMPLHGHVLGIIFRFVHRQVRHQLAVQLRAARLDLLRWTAVNNVRVPAGETSGPASQLSRVLPASSPSPLACQFSKRRGTALAPPCCARTRTSRDQWQFREDRVCRPLALRREARSEFSRKCDNGG